MSITSHTSKKSATTVDIAWTVEQAGLWVARRNGDFVGMVEARWGAGFAATTRLAKTLGTFATIEEAERALEESLD
ncbi:hypothetical protein HD599_003469 [Conyzicola lurida]|uniref:Uncharacterized protein n=1 Tax=Conyzicola lurida TaxID=1172621 RepID=A0A841ATZ6_9MICO|nr:hypothetical protein [Conyzicola lurida]MBB5845146.1 hypothetical protein [Conyzicola lurida]